MDAEGDIVALDAGFVRRWIDEIAGSVEEERDHLTQLDSAIGDADHGVNLSRGFTAVVAKLETAGRDLAPGQILTTVGATLISTVGGASGPLYGTALIQAGVEAGAVHSIDAELVGRMLEAGAAALARRGRCEVGDKTIYDTLAPAVAAYRDALAGGGDLVMCLAAAIHAGAGGMRSTRGLVARRGLALRLGARSVGTLDPGAVSCFLILRAMVPRRQRSRRATGAAATQVAATLDEAVAA